MSAETSGGWLCRSGQAWKLNGSAGANVAAVVAIGASIFLANGFLALLGVLIGVAGAVLPLFVRCRVCRLQMETSDEARRLSSSERSMWLESLQACPSCGDDGRASSESRVLWAQSGRVGQPPYWTATRMLIAAGALLVLHAILMAVTYLDRVRR